MNTTTIQNLAGRIHWLHAKIDAVTPLGFLVMRCFVAWAFLKSGYLKTTSWSSTMYLFENEFHVPLLSPEIAAYLGTFTELAFPSLLIIGLAGRFSAFVLFVFNIIAVISYPDLDPAAAKDHHAWGVMLFVLMLAGPGKWSLDCWIKKKFEAGNALPP